MIDEKKLIEDLKQICPICGNADFKVVEVSDVMNEINNQSKVGEWIPCSERLPDFGGRVLTVRMDYDNISDKIVYPIEIVDFEPENENDVEWFTVEVDAWQPLPLMYEPKEGENNDKCR